MYVRGRDSGEINALQRVERVCAEMPLNKMAQKNAKEKVFSMRTSRARARAQWEEELCEGGDRGQRCLHVFLSSDSTVGVDYAHLHMCHSVCAGCACANTQMHTLSALCTVHARKAEWSSQVKQSVRALPEMRSVCVQRLLPVGCQLNKCVKAVQWQRISWFPEPEMQMKCVMKVRSVHRR